MERLVLGDTYRYRNDTSKLEHVQFAGGLFMRVFLRGGGLSHQTSARQMLHPEDRRIRNGDALCLQLLLERGATKPSSSKHCKTTNMWDNIDVWLALCSRLRMRRWLIWDYEGVEDEKRRRGGLRNPGR